MAGGRDLSVSKGVSKPVVSVKTSGAHGVMEGKQLVSKKVSYKVDIDYSLISFFIVGNAYAASCYFVSLIAVIDVGGDLSCNHGGNRGAEGAREDFMEEDCEAGQGQKGG